MQQPRKFDTANELTLNAIALHEIVLLMQHTIVFFSEFGGVMSSHPQGNFQYRMSDDLLKKLLGTHQWELLQQLIQKCILKNKCCNILFSIGDDHQKFELKATGYPIEQRMVACFFQNITAPKKHFEILRQSHDFFQQYIQYSDDLLLGLTENGQLIFVSPSSEKALGYHSKFMLNKSISCWLHPQDQQTFSQFLKAVTNSNLVDSEITYRLLNAQNKFVWFSSRLTCVREAKGKYIIGNARDISKQKAANDLLAAREDRFNLAIEGSSDGIWDWNIETQDMYFSDRFLTLIDQKKLPLDGGFDVLKKLIHQEDLPELYSKIQQHFTSHAVFSHEFRLSVSDFGYKWFLLRGQAVWNDRGQPMRMAGSLTDIHQQKEAKRMLKKSEERNRLIMYATFDTIVAVNQEGIILQVYQQEKNKLQYSDADLFNQPLFGNILPRISNQAITLLQNDASTSQNQKWLTVAKRKDGSLADVEVTMAALITAEHPEFYVYLKDISAQKKVEDEIKLSNERFEYVTKASLEAIWEWDVKKDEIYYSDGFNLLFGYEVKNLSDSKITRWRLIHPEDRDKIKKSFAKALRSEANFWFEKYRLQKSNGEYAYVQDHSVIVRNKQKRLLRIIGAIKDITAQTHEERQRRLLESVITNATDGVVITNFDDPKNGGPKIVYVNQMMEKITGYTSKELIGQSPKIFRGKQEDQDSINKLRKAINEQKPCEVELLNERKDGQILWMSMTLKPITDETGKFTNWISIQRDISARKERELERERLIQELTQNNNDLRQFSYITTHNLRAPLTNLLGLVDLIDLDHVSDERTRKMVEGFAESTHQLNETLNDLLSILIVKDKANINQANLVLDMAYQETITELSYAIKQSEATIIADFKQAPTLYFNQEYLNSIFLNLLSNAIRYAHPDRKPVIHIRSKKLANHTVLTFEDNGLGMNMQYAKDRIFGLRQRFHDHPNSKGIGLYLVHSQITTLGGTISVSSEENVGTIFTITLKNSA